MTYLGVPNDGIAHEIQCPLNFINDFPEINKEPLAEKCVDNRNGIRLEFEI